MFHIFFQEMRIKSGYKSQKELTSKSKVSAATISRIENGIQLPTIETLKLLAPFLKSTTFDELLHQAGYLETSFVTNDDRTWMERALSAEQELEELKRKIKREQIIKRFGEGVVEGDIIEFNNQSDTLYIYHDGQLFKITQEEFEQCLMITNYKRWSEISKLR